jgi:hypothetical protein
MYNYYRVNINIYRYRAKQVKINKYHKANVCHKFSPKSRITILGIRIYKHCFKIIQYIVIEERHQ